VFYYSSPHPFAYTGQLRSRLPWIEAGFPRNWNVGVDLGHFHFQWWISASLLCSFLAMVGITSRYLCSVCSTADPSPFSLSTFQSSICLHPVPSFLGSPRPYIAAEPPPPTRRRHRQASCFNTNGSFLILYVCFGSRRQHSLSFSFYLVAAQRRRLELQNKESEQPHRLFTTRILIPTFLCSHISAVAHRQTFVWLPESTASARSLSFFSDSQRTEAVDWPWLAIILYHITSIPSHLHSCPIPQPSALPHPAERISPKSRP
jgi:hypothetical protein